MLPAPRHPPKSVKSVKSVVKTFAPLLLCDFALNPPPAPRPYHLCDFPGGRSYCEDCCVLWRQITGLPPEFVPIRVKTRSFHCPPVPQGGIRVFRVFRGDRPPVPNRISTKVRSFSISAGWCLVVVNQGVKWQKRLFCGPGVQPFSVF
jgi:hypothetical protein